MGSKGRSHRQQERRPQRSKNTNSNQPRNQKTTHPFPSMPSEELELFPETEIPLSKTIALPKPSNKKTRYQSNPPANKNKAKRYGVITPVSSKKIMEVAEEVLGGQYFCVGQINDS